LIADIPELLLSTQWRANQNQLVCECFISLRTAFNRVQTVQTRVILFLAFSIVGSDIFTQICESSVSHSLHDLFLEREA
jgi:hypothetical protein